MAEKQAEEALQKAALAQKLADEELTLKQLLEETRKKAKDDALAEF